jgi:hypothetical protein
MKQITRQPAETIQQAQSWENVKNGYLACGLCDKCAAQAAWGHQHHAGSWTQLHPPCGGCIPIVAGFPLATTSPVWRKTTRTFRGCIKRDGGTLWSTLSGAPDPSNRHPDATESARCDNPTSGNDA